VIPSSIVGVAAFVTLLAPGLAYILRHERVIPAQTQTPFRETLRVVFVSVVCLAAVGLIAALARTVFPMHTPDLGSLIRSSPNYARIHYVALAWWAFALLSLATLLGAMLADPRLVRFVGQLRGRKALQWLFGAERELIRDISAWHKVFAELPPEGTEVHVGAHMTDGTYTQGQLYSYNTATREDGDREILLSGPLIRLTDDTEVRLDGVQLAVISSRNIVRIDVTYRSDEAE
jgi:hypothetical protein